MQKSKIKRFSRLLEAIFGQRFVDASSALDVLETEILAEFDEWRNSKQIIILNIVRKRSITQEAGDNHWISMDVLYSETS